MGNAVPRLQAAGWLAVLALAAGLSQAAPPLATDRGTASWDEQLRQPLYVLYQLSTINVINGLDLTHEQVVRLRALAREVERLSPPPPSLDPKRAGPFAPVIAVNLDLRDTLLRGETPSESLRNKVMGARLTEVGLIRRSLLAEWNAKPQGSCTQCHVRPEENLGQRPGASLLDAARFNEKEQLRAHMDLVVGKKTMGAVWWRMNQVDTILTDYQKAAFEGFSCCLLPPDLSGGALKIGQAENPSKMMEVLDEVRSASEREWPVVNNRILSGLTARDRVLHPRRSPREEQNGAERLAAVLQRARDMNEVDFMINKNQLCSDLEPARPKTSNPPLLRFKTAFFLLLPGSLHAYDAYLERLAKKESGTAARASRP